MIARSILLLIFLLTGAACRKTFQNAQVPAQEETKLVSPAPPLESDCPAGLEANPITIRLLGEHQGSEIDPDPGFGTAEQVWTGDLNGDRQPDVILWFPDFCGNWGECPYGVYAGCGHEEYVPVWGPEYALGLAVADDSLRHDIGKKANAWSDLVLTERTGEPDNDYTYEVRLRFVSERYVKDQRSDTP